MQLRRKNKSESEVSTHSLNDILFFLMMFFMIAATMANPNVIKLILPSAKSSQTMAKKQVSLAITKDLVYTIDGKTVAFENLKSTLITAVGNKNESTVIISMDRSLEVQKLVDLLEIGNELKIKMIMATKKP